LLKKKEFYGKTLEIFRHQKIKVLSNESVYGLNCHWRNSYSIL
jgi:hypothetical protein